MPKRELSEYEILDVYYLTIRAIFSAFNPNTYWDSLRQLSRTPKSQWYRKWFTRPKSGGRIRIIQPADRNLLNVQMGLTMWLLKAVPEVLKFDYCYSGRGVMTAVKQHQRLKSAISIDLTDAFEYVNPEKLLKCLQHWCNQGSQEVPQEAFEAIIKLLTCAHPYTAQIRTPQGCVSSPHFFNLVWLQLDQQLSGLFEKHGLDQVTRYSDNLLVSSKNVIAQNVLDEIARLAQTAIEDDGFKVGELNTYAGNRPVPFLGTQIHHARIEIVQKKRDEYRDFLENLLSLPLSDPTPMDYFQTVMGLYSWLRQIYGDRIPTDILWLFVRYRNRVRRPSPQMILLLTKQLTHKMRFWSDSYK